MATAVETKTKWAVDPTHSEVQFKVKHLVISTVTGSFKKFSGEVFSEDETFDGADVNFSIESNSLDTNQADRDGHLKSEDFFAVERFPAINFNGVLEKDQNNYKLVGELSIRDGGVVKDPWGNIKAGFEVNGKINRKDFGLAWNALTEAGGMVVGEEVKLHFNIELAKVA
jgi:polyisoprenoid-binding protein YceI